MSLKKHLMTNQYHEPPEELSGKTRDLARIITSLIEEAEAINWYQQRIDVTKNKEVRAIMSHTQEEEMEHFSIDLEWITRQLPIFKEVLAHILFKKGDIVENAEKWEEEKRERYE